jgi:GTP-binding protein Era
LLDIYDCKINLKLFVKVEKEWRNNPTFLKQNGYSNK